MQPDEAGLPRVADAVRQVPVHTALQGGKDDQRRRDAGQRDQRFGSRGFVMFMGKLGAGRRAP